MGNSALQKKLGHELSRYIKKTVDLQREVTALKEEREGYEQLLQICAAYVAHLAARAGVPKEDGTELRIPREEVLQKIGRARISIRRDGEDYVLEVTETGDTPGGVWTGEESQEWTGDGSQ